MHFFSTLDLMWAYVMFYNISFQTMMLFVFFEFTYKFCVHVIKKIVIISRVPYDFIFFQRIHLYSQYD
jgi:hypothetical protein